MNKFDLVCVCNVYKLLNVIYEIKNFQDLSLEISTVSKQKRISFTDRKILRS